MDIIKDLIKRHEGLRLQMYKCTAGANTIGYGYNLDENPIPLRIAEQLLDHSYEKLEREVFGVFPFLKWLDIERRAVVLDMAFNLGVVGFSRFRKMIDALKKNDYDKAADEMLNSKWALQVPNRANEDAQLMRGLKKC